MATVAQALYAAIVARENCQNSGNAIWLANWSKYIADIMDTAPSGSGIDNGTRLINDCDELGKRTKPNCLRFDVDFHHMSEHGYYDGWTSHVVTVRPTFHGISVDISGRDRNGIKEYLGEVMCSWLTSEAPDRKDMVL